MRQAIPGPNPSALRQDIMPARTRRPIAHICSLLAMVIGLLFRII